MLDAHCSNFSQTNLDPNLDLSFDQTKGIEQKELKCTKYPKSSFNFFILEANPNLKKKKKYFWKVCVEQSLLIVDHQCMVLSYCAHISLGQLLCILVLTKLPSHCCYNFFDPTVLPGFIKSSTDLWVKLCKSLITWPIYMTLTRFLIQLRDLPVMTIVEYFRL